MAFADWDGTAAKAELDASGVVIVPSVLDLSDLTMIRSAIADLIAEDEAEGRQLRGFGYDPDDRNIRLMDIVIRHPIFQKLIEHPIATEIVRHLLGDDYRVSNFSGNITQPGNARMFMHADQGFLPAPWPPYPMSVNIGWAIDDFTIENGGTIYIPASNHNTHGPRPEGAIGARFRSNVLRGRCSPWMAVPGIRPGTTARQTAPGPACSLITSAPSSCRSGHGRCSSRNHAAMNSMPAYGGGWDWRSGPR